MAEALRLGTEQAHRNPRMRVTSFRKLRFPCTFSKTKAAYLFQPPRRSPRSNSVPAAPPSRAGSEVTAAFLVTWFFCLHPERPAFAARAEPASRWRALACLRVVPSAPRSRSLSLERRRGWCGAARGPPRAAASERGQASGVRGAAGLWGGE